MIIARFFDGPLPPIPTPGDLQTFAALILVCGVSLLVEGIALFLYTPSKRALRRQKLSVCCVLMGLGVLFIGQRAWTTYTYLSASEPAYHTVFNQQFGVWSVQVSNAQEVYGSACFLVTLITIMLLAIGAARVYRRRQGYIEGIV